MRYNIAGSMRLHDDTYWHLGFKLHVFTEQEGLPVILPYEFKFKKVDAGFDGSIWEFNNIEEKWDNNVTEDRFIERFLRKVKESLENTLDEFLEQQERREIGFLNNLPRLEEE